MLFVGVPGDQPLTAARAAELMRGVEPGEIPAMVDDLNGRYRATGCPYHVVHEGAGYRLTLRASSNRCGRSSTGGFEKLDYPKQPSTYWPSWPTANP